nr:uncharacterized protein LOC111413383 [Onthophagus taurus]
MQALNKQIDKIQSNIEWRVEQGKNKVEKNDQETQTVNERLYTLKEKIETYEDFEKIREERWTEESFENTEIRRGNPLHNKDNTVLVVLVDPEDPKMERGIQKRIKTRYPDVEDIEEEIGVIEQIYKIKTKDQMETKRRKIIKMTYKSTKEGKLIITMDKDAKVMGKVKDAIIKSNESIHVKQFGDGNKEIIHIRGMDALADKEEIQTAIQEIIGKTNCKMELGELRPMLDETRAISVKIDKQGAEILLKHRNIKIGFTRCEIERRINIQRCFKCWGFGHSSRDCSDPDRGKLCFKCGKEGHVLRDCQNEEHCPICNQEGHKAGAGKCEEFKMELNIRRNAERQYWRKEWAKEVKQAQ